MFETRFILAEILVLAGTAGAGGMAPPPITRISARLKRVHGRVQFRRECTRTALYGTRTCTLALPLPQYAVISIYTAYAALYIYEIGKVREGLNFSLHGGGGGVSAKTRTASISIDLPLCLY